MHVFYYQTKLKKEINKKEINKNKQNKNKMWGKKTLTVKCF